MKAIYEAPDIEIVALTALDIIADSEVGGPSMGADSDIWS